MKKKSGVTIVELISIFIILLPAIGYVANIYKLTQCDFKEPYRAEAIRAIGLIPVVGMITGYMEIEDK